MMQVDSEDGDGHINGYAEGGDGDEQAEDEQRSAKEFREGCDIAQPVGQAEVANCLREAVERAAWEDFVPAVNEHDGAENDASDEHSQRLKTVQPCEHP